MSYQMEPTESNCYSGTSCLINKLGIQDSKKLSQLEADVTLAKAALLESSPLVLPLDFEYYKSIHRFLFEDLYDWAGTVRTVNLSKKATVFCPVDQLETACEGCFKRLRETDYFRGCSKTEFIDELVDFYCTTNYLHPFREGNGRTQRIFIAKLIHLNGYNFRFSSIDHDLLMVATIQAANGVTTPLHNLFSSAIQ